MFANKNGKKNEGHDGFVWSQYLPVIGGTLLALAFAVARIATALAGSVEWGK